MRCSFQANWLQAVFRRLHGCCTETGLQLCSQQASDVTRIACEVVSNYTLACCNLVEHPVEPIMLCEECATLSGGQSNLLLKGREDTDPDKTERLDQKEGYHTLRMIKVMQALLSDSAVDRLWGEIFRYAPKESRRM